MTERIPIEKGALLADLEVFKNAKALIIFAHGSGSSRLSSRNRFVAQALQKGGLATLLFDLLTEEEDRLYENRFDIPLLVKRLMMAYKWALLQKSVQGLPVGFFGASTGAAAALAARQGITPDALDVAHLQEHLRARGVPLQYADVGLRARAG